MIVDCHSHIFQYPANFSEEFIREAQARSRPKPIDLDASPEKHWAAMRSVDRVIVFGLRASYFGHLVPNEFVAAYANQHPEKVIGFASVDPTYESVRATLEYAIDKLKLRGVKIGPIYQNIHPTDKRMMEVYEFCQARKLPIMIHQGTTFLRRAPLKYSLPILLEDVALEFPDLKMIIAHMGHPWIGETIVLIRKQPNFYADVSALYYRPWQFYNALILAKEYGVLDKLLFGTDYPFTTPETSLQGLRNFDKLTQGTSLPRLEEEEIEGLIHAPALALLGL